MRGLLLRLLIAALLVYLAVSVYWYVFPSAARDLDAVVTLGRVLAAAVVLRYGVPWLRRRKAQRGERSDTE
jgi:hypothetical protein